MVENNRQQEYNPGTNRNIQNAQIKTAVDRSRDRADDRTLQAELGRRRTFATNNSRYLNTNKEDSRVSYEKNGRNNTIQSPKGREALTEIKTMFKNEDENFEDGDMQLLIENPPKKSDFPFLIFPLAVIKDIIDFSDLTGVGILLTTITSFIIAVILFVWLLGKMQGGWWKKKMLRWLLKRYGLVIVIECIPFLKIVPATTILILMAHNREKKFVKLMNSALERLHHAHVR